MQFVVLPVCSEKGATTYLKLSIKMYSYGSRLMRGDYRYDRQYLFGSAEERKRVLEHCASAARTMTIEESFLLASEC
jgi:hypothetical protein